jgi:hypothetical protein
MSESSASPWQTLLPAAMVGTDKMAFSSPALSGPVGALLAQIQAQAAQPALALLQTAGVLAVCERAGQQGSARAAPALDAAAAPETAPALQAKSLQISLRWALADAPLRLQIEVLQRLSAVGLRLPNALLPLALEAGQRSVALRPALLAVLGERGRWLARRNTAWRYAESAAGDAPLETRWSDGSLAQRVELLRGERQRDPASARERLKTALLDLPAKDRTELAAVLIEGLSLEDEALLTALCQDRGRDVRQNARALLVQLPESAATQRAIARMQACLEKQSALKSLLGAKWKIDAPQAAADDWKADGLEAERPKNESLGERAWWLYQLVRQVPLAWWESHTGMTPAALLQWAAKTDWHAALGRAWLDVLRTAPGTAWCQAFLDHWPGKAVRDNPAAVLALLQPAQREPYWMQALQGKESAHASFIDTMGQIVQACPPGAHVSLPLSELLVHTLQDCLRDKTAMPRHAYELSTQLPELCCVLHPGALPAWQALPHTENEASWLTNALDRCLQPIAARLAFATLVPASANSITSLAP